VNARDLVVAGAALALGATLVIATALGLRPATLVEVTNPARGATLRVPLAEGEVFSVTSQHSMYDAPVTEEFRVEDGRIALVAVTSPSAAVREYFGFTTAGERHAIHRVMREVVFRIAAGAPQRLRAGGAERSFLDLGAHGDRLVLRAVHVPSLLGALARAAP
jgi:hypothetical protein